MNGAVPERLCERGVDQLVLVQQGETVEARARHCHLEVIATARAILDAKLARVGKRVAKEGFEMLDSHAAMLLAAWLPAGEGTYAMAGTSSGTGVRRSYAGS